MFFRFVYLGGNFWMKLSMKEKCWLLEDRSADVVRTENRFIFSGQTWCTNIYGGFVIFSRSSVSTLSSAFSRVVWVGFCVRITIHVQVKTLSHTKYFNTVQNHLYIMFYYSFHWQILNSHTLEKWFMLSQDGLYNHIVGHFCA